MDKINFTSKKMTKKCFMENGILKCQQHTTIKYPDGKIEETKEDTEEENAKNEMGNIELDKNIRGDIFKNQNEFFNMKDFEDIFEMFSNPFEFNKTFGIFVEEDDPFVNRRNRNSQTEKSKESWDNYPTQDI
eukprot:TRINITY_DN6413_c0_g1_i1.p1 TRINITY_DN6413_c0_g1~~TRINITY_DN6413_c0_g1_i1.p1  ORF type:complete len:132 (-),score=43.60 TRINITY_DN6413_c0_g1_i1:56-451(-)